MDGCHGFVFLSYEISTQFVIISNWQIKCKDLYLRHRQEELGHQAEQILPEGF
jgi:hypothetical protein